MWTGKKGKIISYLAYLLLFITIIVWINSFYALIAPMHSWRSIFTLADFSSFCLLEGALLLSFLWLYPFFSTHIDPGSHSTANIADTNLRFMKAWPASSRSERHKQIPEQADIRSYILDHLPKSIVVINNRGEIIYFNHQASLKLGIKTDKNGCIGLGDFPFTQDKINNIWDWLASGKSWKEEQSIIINGKKRTLMHRVDTMDKYNGQSLMTVVSYDISDLTAARHNAETARIAQSHFLANITHELRTPMIGILGAVDLLEHSSLNRKQTDSVDIIRDCGEQLLNIINDIINVSKIDIGLIELTPSATNLREILKKATGVIEANLHEKKLLMELDLDNNLPSTVLLDQVKFRQVIVNILSNAVKFTPRGGIKLSARLDDSTPNEHWLLFSVADTGIGIPAENMNHIFDYFTQVDTSTSRKFGGTGLGLYICKELIVLMGGEIWVESTVGMGSTFSIRIPLLMAPDLQNENILEPGSQMAASDDLPVEFTAVSVLLVEDNELNQKLLTQMLINYGFEVVTASNGLECLSILQRKNVDIILMDMLMPIMDGYEATQIIRQNPSWSHLPIIAVTANSLNDDREKCLACGCSSYLAKPFKSETLVKEIRTYLKNQLIKRKTTDPFSQRLIAELLPEFLEMLDEMLQDLDKALERKDIDSIKHISHSLKGTAGMYGFSKISELASYIERASQNKDFSRMGDIYHQIKVLAEQASNHLNTEVM